MQLFRSKYNSIALALIMLASPVFVSGKKAPRGACRGVFSVSMEDAESRLNRYAEEYGDFDVQDASTMLRILPSLHAPKEKIEAFSNAINARLQFLKGRKNGQDRARFLFVLHEFILELAKSGNRYATEKQLGDLLALKSKWNDPQLNGHMV